MNVKLSLDFDSYRDLTSHLEFSPETVVLHPQFTHLVMNHSLNEGLDTKLEITGCKQNVSPDVLMNAGVLFKKILNRFSIYPALLMSSIVDVGDIVISQECGKVLGVPDVFTYLRYCRLLHYFPILPFVST